MIESNTITAVIIVIVLALVKLFFTVHTMARQIRKFKHNTNEIDRWKTQITKRVALIETSNNKVLYIVSLNADDIQCAKAQVSQLQHYIYQMQPYMNSALEISNLINCAEHDVSLVELIASVKAALEWEQEVLRLNKTPESEYYKGD